MILFVNVYNALTHAHLYLLCTWRDSQKFHCRIFVSRSTIQFATRSQLIRIPLKLLLFRIDSRISLTELVLLFLLLLATGAEILDCCVLFASEKSCGWSAHRLRISKRLCYPRQNFRSVRANWRFPFQITESEHLLNYDSHTVRFS